MPAARELLGSSRARRRRRCAGPARPPAPGLAAAIQSHLPDLAMPKAVVGIDAEGDEGGRGGLPARRPTPVPPLQPLAKVASGGELARTMLALRSVLSEAPPVLVFDEVDAGIGGSGRPRRRLLPVQPRRPSPGPGGHTHLPQVAAFADAHLAVEKRQGTDETVSEIRLLDTDGQLVELARMLSGQPESMTARQHAKELVAEADRAKIRG